MFTVQPSISGNTATAGALKLRVISPADATLHAVDWTTVDSDYLSGWRIDIGGATTGYVVELGAGDSIFGAGFE